MSPLDSPSPEDLDLAHRLGEALEHQEEHAAPYEALGLLDAYVILAEDEKKLAPDGVTSERMWRRIEGRTWQDKRTPARLFAMPGPTRWAAAAMLLVAATIVFFVVQSPRGETLIAEAGTSVEVVTLDDGSIIELRPRSAVYAVPADHGTTTVRLEGEALFDVTADVNRSFSVVTPQAAVMVVGTRFNVSTWGDRTEVYLHRGQVAVERDEVRKLLEPGMAALVENAEITTSSSADASEYLDWTRGELTFVARPASIVAAELAHHFGIDVLVQQPLADETVTGSLPLQGAEESLRALATVLGADLWGSPSGGYVLGER